MRLRNVSPQKPSQLTVNGLMIGGVATVRPDETLHRVARLMTDRDCGCVPVVDRHNKLVGIVTDRDITLAAVELDTPLRGIRTSTVMTRDPITIRPEDTLGSAMELMRAGQVRRLPVVDEDHNLIGLLTLGDIVRVVAHLRRSGADRAAADALVETLAAIGERRPGNVTSIVSPS